MAYKRISQQELEKTHTDHFLRNLRANGSIEWTPVDDAILAEIL